MAALVHNQAWQEASRVSLTFSATTTTGEAGGEAAGGGAGGGGSHGELAGVRRVDPATGAEVVVSSASVSLAASGSSGGLGCASRPGKVVHVHVVNMKLCAYI